MMTGVVLALLLHTGVVLLPPSQASQDVRAAVILPADPQFVVSLPKALPVLRLAALASSTRYLPGRQFLFVPSDDRCEPDHALKNAVTAKMCPGDRNRLHVLFGPTCEYNVAQVGRLIKFWSTPLITTGALTFDFTRDKTSPTSEFHLLVRMGPISFADVAHFIIALLNKYSWRKVMLVYTKDGCRQVSGKHTCKLMMETLVEFLKARNISYGAYDTEKNTRPLKRNLAEEIGVEFSENSE